MQVTPVQKVVQLLENMKEKGTKEMQEEEVQYTKFKQFCDMTLAEKEAAIGEAADKIETLEADIEKAASEAERLGKEMSEHQTDIEAATAEKEKATRVREKGRTDFQLTLKGLQRVYRCHRPCIEGFEGGGQEDSAASAGGCQAPPRRGTAESAGHTGPGAKDLRIPVRRRHQHARGPSGQVC